MIGVSTPLQTPQTITGEHQEHFPLDSYTIQQKVVEQPPTYPSQSHL